MRRSRFLLSDKSACTHTHTRSRVCSYVCGRQCLRNAFSFFTLFLGISFRLLLHDSIHNAYLPIYSDITCVYKRNFHTHTHIYIQYSRHITMYRHHIYYRNTGRRATVLSRTIWKNRFNIVSGIVFIYNKMCIIYRVTRRV